MALAEVSRVAVNREVRGEVAISAPRRAVRDSATLAPTSVDREVQVAVVLAQAVLAQAGAARVAQEVLAIARRPVLVDRAGPALGREVQVVRGAWAFLSIGDDSNRKIPRCMRS